MVESDGSRIIVKTRPYLSIRMVFPAGLQGPEDIVGDRAGEATRTEEET